VPCTSLLIFGIAGALSGPLPVRAHAIESSLVRLQALHNTLELDSHFSSGVPVDGALVRLVSPDGQQSIAVGRTDRLGALRFQVPASANSSWEVQVDGGAGHRDYLEMPVQAGQAQLDRVSQHHARPLGLASLAGLGGLGAAAMLLGLQRIRRPR
jgi:hypothetical protein